MKGELRTIDAFGIVHDCDRTNSVDLSNRFVDEWSLEYDKETGSTRPVISGKVDFVASIQTFKDQCGVDAAVRDLAAGRRSIERLSDDGNHGGDFSRSTEITLMADQVKKAALASMKADEQAKSKGLDPKALRVDGLDLEAYITKEVAARIAAAAPAKEDGGKK